jgi:hypothetical protein
LNEQNTEFVEQIESNSVDQEKLGGKKYTLGGSPFVNIVSSKKDTVFSATIVPPKTSYSVQAMSRVLSADLTPYDVHLLLLYVRDHFPPPEVFIVTDEVQMGVEQ